MFEDTLVSRHILKLEHPMMDPPFEGSIQQVPVERIDAQKNAVSTARTARRAKVLGNAVTWLTEGRLDCTR